MNFENLDINDIGCFGFESPKKDCWLTMLSKASIFADVKDPAKFEKSLKWNVEAAYYRLCGITFTDLDTDTRYFMSFLNAKKAWIVEIVDSKDAEVTNEEIAQIKNNELLSKIVDRAAQYIEEAYRVYNEKVDEAVKQGKLVSVDELKLEAVLNFVNDSELMNAFKHKKFM